jgi:hypothetical protein
MRRWYVPLTVLGLGGVGAFLLSERGRSAIRGIIQSFRETPDRLMEWNENLDSELDRIQTALNQIAESLDSNRGLSQE